jgi:hypothetical protein
MELTKVPAPILTPAEFCRAYGFARGNCWRKFKERSPGQRGKLDSTLKDNSSAYDKAKTEAKISDTQAHRWQQLAAMPHEVRCTAYFGHSEYASDHNDQNPR